MNKNLLVLTISLAFTCLPGIIQGKEDINAGKEKSAMCTGCHGSNGNSAMPLFPKLAGQHPKYLILQMRAFKDGSRDDATMSPMALGLSEQDMIDIAAYYASQKSSSNTLPELDDDDEDEDNSDTKQADDIYAMMDMGSDIYRNGDLKQEVSACIACHGPYGEGNKPAGFPALRSQHADYLIKTLKDFKSDARSNNRENMMHMIAKKMSDEEIEAVSYHISMMK